MGKRFLCLFAEAVQVLVRLGCIGILITLSSCSPGLTQRGEMALRLGDYELALSLFAEVLRSDPASVRARTGIAKALIQRAVDSEDSARHDWKSALMHLDAARTLGADTAIDGMAAQVWTINGDHLLAGGDTVGALESFARAIELAPGDAQPLSRAGFIYFRMGYFDKAGLLLQRAARLDSGTVHRFNLGAVYWEQGRIDSAHAVWEQVLREDPDDADALYWYAMAEKRMRESTR